MKTNDDKNAALAATPVHPALRLALTSSLFVALLGFVFTLFGLLYRAGYLGKFGLSTENLLPDSSADLTFWAYISVIELLSETITFLKTTKFWVWIGFTSALLFAGINTWNALEGREPPEFFRKLRRKLRENRTAQGLAGSLLAIFVVSFLPWIALGIAIAAIGFPIFSYTAGQTAAERDIKIYKATLTTNPERCVVLHRAEATVGDCLFIIAQTKDRIVYADHDRVRIAWSKDLEPSWSSSALREELGKK